jgi:serralysin
LDGVTGSDILLGRGGDDSLYGGEGNDTIFGGGGEDVIVGGGGTDVLYSRASVDRFVFYFGDASADRNDADTIYGFSGRNGDRIDLSDIDANVNRDGNQAFHFVGKSAFGHHAGELHYVTAHGSTYIEADADGDATADLVIHLTKELVIRDTYFTL